MNDKDKIKGELPEEDFAENTAADKEAEIPSEEDSKNALWEKSGAQTDRKKKLPELFTKTWFIAIAAALAVVISIGILIGVAMNVQGLTLREIFGMEARSLDYLNDSLSPYISISDEDYKGFDVEININEPTDIDLENKIIQLLKSNKASSPSYSGKYQTKKAITAADRVYVYYAAYTKDSEGKRTYITDICNYGDASAEMLVIGSGDFPVGFELGLIDKIPNSGKFEIFDYGDVSEGDVVYATVTYIDSNGLVYDNASVRIDLGDESCENIWGEGIYDYLTEKQIGLTNADPIILRREGNGEKIYYLELTVDYVTRFDVSDAITVEATLPYDYGDPELNCKTVYYDVFVEQTLCYETPDFDEDFILNTLGFTEEALSVYEGDTIVERCKAYYMEQLIAEYEKTRDLIAEEAVWEALKNNIKIKKYPEREFNRVYEDYVYSYNLAYIEENSLGLGYEDLDEYITVQMGLEDGEDWTQPLSDIVKDEIKEKLIFYSILRREGWVPEGDEFDEVYRNELALDYEYYTGKTAADFDTAEEFELALDEFEAMVIEAYGEEFYLDSVYYNYASSKMIGLVNIVNLAEK